MFKVSRRRWLWFVAGFLALLTPVIIGASIWIYKLNDRISARIKERRFAPPVEFWHQGQALAIGDRFTSKEILDQWRSSGYRKRQSDQVLFPGDYSIWSAEECLSLTESESSAALSRCIAFNLKTANAAESDSRVQIIGLDDGDRITELWRGTPPITSQFAELAPQLFAEFYGSEPILRREITLGDTPPACLNALLAIEDSEFLQHQGINFMSLGRALLANLTSGRYAQGGSTITQQMVKNYFLTAERTLKRKFVEIAMSVLLEAHLSKDEILETYVNLIYMGQNGPFQIRGFGSAAEHYFGTDLENLDLPQCALMAALVNSPGLFNPFTRPEAALQRRHRVLNRMQELGYIDTATAEQASKAPLPARPAREINNPAPYFVDAVMKQIRSLEIDTSEGLRIYTTMNPNFQIKAQTVVEEELANLAEKNKNLKALKAKDKHLEGLLIAIDNQTGGIKALVGGRNFRLTQFNRAVDAKRQIGSIMKPLVYLAALENPPTDGEGFSPLTLIDDSKFTFKEKKQTWSPDNYDKKYRGLVPAFFALSQSLNSATAQLGLQVGLENVVNVAERAGITAVLQPYPSLSLGAFEVLPLEVAEVMITLARMGNHIHPLLIDVVESLEGEVIYHPTSPSEQRFTAKQVASLVSMMKQTLVSGTARAVQAHFPGINAAGKTGTTSDLKDTWFVGFTPEMTVVTWVGFDDNTSTGLTGASGALPLWIRFMRETGLNQTRGDFAWPSDSEIEHKQLQKEDLISLIPEWQGSDTVDLILCK